MANSVLGTLLQYGLELAETGLNATKFSVRYEPEFMVKTKNHQNQTTGRILPTVASRKISVDAEVLTSGAAGMMLATFLVDQASHLANDVGDFGSPVGIIMLNSADVEQTRDGLRSVRFELESDPLFTAV